MVHLETMASSNLPHSPSPTPDHFKKAVMERFKQSVLDENGRVRRMSQHQAREVARVAADGILLQVSHAILDVFCRPRALQRGSCVCCNDLHAAGSTFAPRLARRILCCNIIL